MTTSGYNHADDILKFVQHEHASRSVTRTLLEEELRTRNAELLKLEDELFQLEGAIRALGGGTQRTEEVTGVESPTQQTLSDSGVQHFRIDFPHTEEESLR